jgi:hypothetical protein
MFIRWRNKKTGCAWFVRKLGTDGNFYGDITDTKGMKQRNFRGNINKQTLDKIFELCNALKAIESNIAGADDSAFIATIGRELKIIEFQGGWTILEDVPSNILSLVRLMNPCIAKSLILSGTDNRDAWNELLAEL